MDAETIRHLTLANKAQQRAWLSLFEGDDTYAPRGSQLKAWLFGGGAISVRAALFDMADYSGQIVTNLFEEDGYFADRSEEHTSELQSLMRISYAVFCLKKNKTRNPL